MFILDWFGKMDGKADRQNSRLQMYVYLLVTEIVLNYYIYILILSNYTRVINSLGEMIFKVLYGSNAVTIILL